MTHESTHSTTARCKTERFFLNNILCCMLMMTQHAKVQSTAKCLLLRSLHLQFCPSHHQVYYLVSMSIHTVKATIVRHGNVMRRNRHFGDLGTFISLKHCVNHVSHERMLNSSVFVSHFVFSSLYWDAVSNIFCHIFMGCLLNHQLVKISPSCSETWKRETT